jgi:hypothetical protein
MLPLEFFERLSCMYQAQMMDPWWQWYTDEPGPRRALALFAGQYAYERQGRARSYPHAAYFAIEKTPALDAVKIWHAFLSELDGARPNKNLNPLYHTGARCNCVCCTFADGDGGIVDVIEAARSELAAGSVRHAFECLDRVRGVGPKIASFFLRDVAVRFSIEPLHDRELLQPIDVWVRRYVTRFTGAAAPVGDILAAQLICANSAAPEAANQGLWYFASQIASSEVKLRHALTNDQYARALVERYVDNLRDVVAAWRGPDKHDPSQPRATT